MTSIPVQSCNEKPEITAQLAPREPHRGRIARYTGIRMIGRKLRRPETRGTAVCCIRSKSSRFFIHPFREGNGRIQRLFWSRVAVEAGWVLDWRPIHGEYLDEVSRVAREDLDTTELKIALELCVTKI